MTHTLFGALYLGTFAIMLVLTMAESLLGWALFLFIFIAVFGGLTLFAAQRPQLVAAGFLLAWLLVILEGYYGVLGSARDWLTIFVGASMATLSALTFLWVLFTYKPSPKTAEVAPLQTILLRLPTVRARPKARPMEALRCPRCGGPGLEGGYPEYRCPYCGSRFAAGEAPPGAPADSVDIVLVQAGEKRVEVVKVVRQAK